MARAAVGSWPTHLYEKGLAEATVILARQCTRPRRRRHPAASRRVAPGYLVRLFKSATGLPPSASAYRSRFTHNSLRLRTWNDPG